MILFSNLRICKWGIFLCSLILHNCILANHYHDKLIASMVDKPGMVINSRLLNFKEPISNAYNASIIEQENGYCLVFRHDTTNVICNPCRYYQPVINMVDLNKEFEQITPIKKIILPTNSPEDPRINVVNGQLFLTYNDEIAEHLHNKNRKIFVGKLDRDRGRLFDVQQLASNDISLTNIEKNWVPFEYPEYSGSLYYVYMASPFKVIKVGDNGSVSVINGQSSVPSQYIDQVWKKDLWGGIRGGTPARLIDDVYLTFFHSWKYHKKQDGYYYVMGAYIFQSKPPFKILAVTPQPIFFKNMYSAQHKRKNLHVVFPSGFAIERKDGKVIFHVSCGENDTSVRIVSIDKDALFRSLVRLA